MRRRRVKERNTTMRRREEERERMWERKRDRRRVYSAHSSARSIGECLVGRRTWTTHTVPRDHRASPLAYIRRSAWLPENYTVARVDRSIVAAAVAAAAVRYFDTVDTRLISIRYGRRGTNCRTNCAEYFSVRLSHPRRIRD